MGIGPRGHGVHAEDRTHSAGSTTYDAEGWSEQAVTILAWSIEATIAHRAHPTTSVFNAAQEALRKASRSFGAASYVRVRYYDRNGAPDAQEGTARHPRARRSGAEGREPQRAGTMPLGRTSRRPRPAPGDVGARWRRPG
ncbi:phage tail tube protein [Streptomyces sp. NPDC003027]